MGLAVEKKIMTIDSNREFDTVIVGLGNTGYATACFLARQNIRFAVTDSRAKPPKLEIMQRTFPNIPLFLGGFDEELIMNVDELLISPGVSLSEPVIAKAIQSGVSVYGDIELFCRNISAPVVAVTGSNGKSTVTTLVADMAREDGMHVAKGGNIGTPALELLAGTDPDIYVLELSSFQMETVSSLNAAAAVVLNISEDHMDRYVGISNYALAKKRIYSGNGVMVINLDDPLVADMKINDRNTLCFTFNEPCENAYGTRIYKNKRWLVRGNEKLMPAEKLQIKGDHNIVNALAALALGEAIELSREAMLNVLQRFSGLPHRCQWVTDINGVSWYNDSKGTNVGASCAAIKGLAGNRNIILIAGGEGKGANFSKLADIARGRLQSAILIGRDGPLIKSALQGVVPVYEAKNMDAAVTMAGSLASVGDLVLLSPACASFDMFENYQARGDAFSESVKKLMS